MRNEWVGLVGAAIIAAALVAGSGARTEAQQGRGPLSDEDRVAIDRCVHFMLTGPAYDGIRIHGREFNCRPLTAELRGSGDMELTGRITFRRPPFGTESPKFEIQFGAQGTIRDIEINDRSEADRTLIHNLSDLATRRTGRDQDTRAVQLAYALTNADLNDPRQTARLILAAVALRATYGYVNRFDPHVRAFFVDRPGHDLGRVTLQSGQTYSAAGGRAQIHVDDRYPESFIEACISICTAQRNCEAWTLLRGSRRNPICIQKGHGTEPYVLPEAVSGVVRTEAAPPPAPRGGSPGGHSDGDGAGGRQRATPTPTFPDRRPQTPRPRPRP